MRRLLSGHTFIWVTLFLLLSLMPPIPSASAQPAPCPEEYPFDETVGTCVDPETGLPYDPFDEEEPIEEDPSAIDETVDGEEPSLDEIEEEMGLTDQNSSLGLTLRHYACDAGFDPRQSTGRVAACTGAGKPAFTYTVTDYEGRPVSTVTVQTGDGTYGETRIDATKDVPMAGMVITVSPVAGWSPAWVTCTILFRESEQRKVEPAIANGSVSILADAGEDVICAWFNVALAAEDQAGDEVVGDGSLVDEPVGNDQIVADQQGTITPSGGSVTMSFLSMSCPAGIGFDGELDRICTEGLANVTYEILSETETLARNATDGNGVLFFENVPDGLLAMVESVPAGYGQPYVLCTHYSPTNGDSEYAPTIEYGTGFMTTVAPGDDLNCTWYNFPAAGPDNGPTIMIQTRSCEGYENGFPAEATLAEAEAACPGYIGGQDFEVSLDGQVVATGESNGVNGQVTFTKLPVSESGGLHGIATLVGVSNKTVAVFCDKDNGDGVYEVVPSPLTVPNQIDQQLVAGDILRCSWFINTDYGSGDGGASATGTVEDDPFLPGVRLVARLCNPGADLTQGAIDAACPTAGAGIAFNVDMSGEPYLNSTTDAGGVIDVPLPVGDATFTIIPQAPAGYGQPGYLCVSIQQGGGGGGKVVRLTEEMPSHDLTWTSDSEATCTYYFPVVAGDAAAGQEGAEDAGSGANTLTIQFWTCPTGFDPAADQTQLLVECAVDVESRDLSVTTDGETTALALVGGGQWEFQSDTVVVEISGDLTSTVWCSSTWIENGEDGGDFPAVAPMEGSVLTLTVSHTATTIYCDWFVFAA
jgi:hypothetical protein